MAETRRFEQALPPDIPDVDPERELPPAQRPSNARLNETAEAIGGALGSAARQVQNARDRLTVIRGGAQGGRSTGEQITEKAEQIKNTAQTKAEEVGQRARSALHEARIQAAARIEDARQATSRLAQEARQSASQRVRLVRARAARLADERPVQVVLGIGAAAFLLGIILRVGRGKRG
ncbi:MAG TPA: hypothetical protein VKT29_15540 [Terriglobales bacterium]|nr:hypothetical protein [Terriglobales bacterium]